jgi:threonine aldolase
MAPPVDLRSDTLTMPTPEMRRAMAEAELGDDVFGEDPTVNRLQRRAAELLDKEDALFVASGTMGNLLGVLSLARSGQEVVADADSHLFLNEGGGAAALGGVQVRQVPTEAGVMAPEQVRRAVRPLDDVHQPLTAAVCVEDTHNLHGGVAWPLAALGALRDVASEHGLAVHMDGARMFNAAVALGVPVAEVAATSDTVTFCLSKGLGAPVGSVLCGPRDVIERARRWRKMVGGGWREAGVLAAAGPRTTRTPAPWPRAWPRWTVCASTSSACRRTSSSWSPWA